MFHQLRGLINAETAPHVISISMTSGASVTLLKQAVTEDDRRVVLWAGVPVGSNGRRCPFGLVIRDDARPRGGAALNFMTCGNWTHGQERPSRALREDTTSAIARDFVSACLRPQETAETKESIAAAIEKEAGYPTKSGKLTKKDRVRAALVNIRPSVVGAAEFAGLKFIIDAETVVSAKLKNGFCAVRKGVWTPEAQELAVTSALPSSMMLLLMEDGLVLYRPPREPTKGRK